jgi:predicted HicB family RNase H-like nuclease
MLSYRGYEASITRDADSGILWGQVLGIRDVITFEAETEQQAEDEFHKSVDIYLAFCQELREEPDQP